MAESKPKVATPVFTTNCIWDGDTNHTLVMDCSDPRLAVPRAQFLREYLKVDRYDSIIVPSGPTVITISEVTFLFDRARVEMLHRLHSFNRVIGIAHHDCGYYKGKHPEKSDAERCELQIADLHRFHNDAQTLVPNAKVELFYAGPDSRGFTAYTRVV